MFSIKSGYWYNASKKCKGNSDKTDVCAKIPYLHSLMCLNLASTKFGDFVYWQN